MGERQQILHLWLAAAALDTEVTAWSFYSGAGSDEVLGPNRPYRTGVDAIGDGWMLIQAPGPIDPVASNGELSCEFVFERRFVVDEAVD